MGPKKKAGKGKKAAKGKAGSKGPTIIDGVPVSEMTKEQLEGHVRRLQEEVSKTEYNRFTAEYCLFMIGMFYLRDLIVFCFS